VHREYIDLWDQGTDLVEDDQQPHSNEQFREYLAWYPRATRTSLRQQWTGVDYADIESSEDEDTVYDRSTREGRVVEAGPMFDRVLFSGELVEANN